MCALIKRIKLIEYKCNRISGLCGNERLQKLGKLTVDLHASNLKYVNVQDGLCTVCLGFRNYLVNLKPPRWTLEAI